VVNKKRYREFSKKEAIPIFSTADWLDAVCGKDNWDVIFVEKDHKIVATMPYVKKKRMNLSMIFMPILTQTMGPYIKYPKNQKYERKLSYEKELMTLLINQLPTVDFFFQNFHYTITNWLPFKWKGFEESTQYTYILSDLSDLESVWKNFRSNIKTDIKKAKKVITVEENFDIEEFYKINQMTFGRQNLKIPYSLEFLQNIDTYCCNRSCRKILMAYDSEKNIHAVIYVIWDNNTMYYLMSGGNPQYRNSGANSLLVWEAIQLASKMKLVFDFEGSTIEPIERVFRAFGAKQTPYFRIIKFRNKFIKLLFTIYKG